MSAPQSNDGAASRNGPTYALRDYQLAAIESVEKAFELGQRRVAIVIPTGGGKTVIFAELINRWGQS